VSMETLILEPQCGQGKEYVFIANSDNLGAIVDLSIQTPRFGNFDSSLLCYFGLGHST
jgi:hypothetical protein